jgi:hypothetical protein
MSTKLTNTFSRYIFLVAMVAMLGLLVPVANQTSAQIQQGATMTVLAGQVAVLRTNGSAVQPAPSGTEVFPGDEIRTLTQSGALITFFAGTEIELGADTILVVQSVSRPGDRVDVTVREVSGTSVSRVHSFIDAGGGYRVEAGGVVALVRGSELGVLGPRDGIVVFINFESSLPIIVNDRCFLSPGVGVWLFVEPDGRGGWRVLSDCHEFRANLAAGPWNALEEGFTSAQQDEQGDTRKHPAGQVPGGQVEEIRSELKKKKDDDDSTATTTTSAGSTVTVNPEVVVTTTRTTTAPVTVTTGATSTTVTTVTASQTTTVPLTTTTSVTNTLTTSVSSTTTTIPVSTQFQTSLTTTTTTTTIVASTSTVITTTITTETCCFV